MKIPDNALRASGMTVANFSTAFAIIPAVKSSDPSGTHSVIARPPWRLRAFRSERCAYGFWIATAFGLAMTRNGHNLWRLVSLSFKPGERLQQGFRYGLSQDIGAQSGKLAVDAPHFGDLP